jgi:arginine repressor
MAKKKTVQKKPGRKKTVAKKKRAAKKKPVSNSQAIRDYLKTHKNAGPKEIQAALAKKGIKVTAALVSNVKSNAKKKSAGTQAKVRVTKKAADRTPLQDVKEAGDLLMQAVELVVKAGAKEAQQLVSTASEVVKKIRSSD